MGAYYVSFSYVCVTAKGHLCHLIPYRNQRSMVYLFFIAPTLTDSELSWRYISSLMAKNANSSHLSDAMAAPKRERLSGMGLQLRRHSAASWHVTPSSLAVAPIACVFLPLRLRGAGTTSPRVWCSAPLHCVRAVPPPRCALQPHRDG